jgi:hypothetical protein
MRAERASFDRCQLQRSCSSLVSCNAPLKVNGGETQRDRRSLFTSVASVMPPQIGSRLRTVPASLIQERFAGSEVVFKRLFVR